MNNSFAVEVVYKEDEVIAYFACYNSVLAITKFKISQIIRDSKVPFIYETMEW